MQEGGEWKSILEKYNFEKAEEVEITRRTTYVKGAGRIENIVPIAFNLNEAEISAPIKTKYGFMIFKVNSKELFDEEKYQQKRGELLKSILETRQREVLDDYLEALKEKADIEDYLTPAEEI